MTATRIRIFYPADPMGVVPGGIDTFLRGLIKWAPPDLEFSLVGMTTDTAQRPLGRWTRCRLGERDFDFYPAVAVGDAGKRGRVPLSVRFGLATQRQMSAVQRGFDVFEFHRPELSLLFESDGRPKNAFFHNDSRVVLSKSSDNLWRHLPGVYEMVERRAMAGMASAWCVHQTGVQSLQARYPSKAESIKFIPTWVDPSVFYPVDESRRAEIRAAKAATHQIDTLAQWVVSVGRLDTSKDPVLMLAAVTRLRRQGRRIAWLVIGDGVLRRELERAAAAEGVADVVHFLGLLPPPAIADWLRAADAYALTSAYEGMPMALLEALGCGLPAAVTDVGEVRRVVRPGVNGAVAAERDAAHFAAALDDVLARASAYRGAPALDAVRAYHPADVLAAAYENYRVLGRDMSTLRHSMAVMREVGDADRQRRYVVDVPIDVLDRATVIARLIQWAKQGESRYMCFVNVHSAVHTARDERHRLVLLHADIAAPDGAPVAWTLRMKGEASQRRVDGPGMMWHLCSAAQTEQVKVGLYGSSPQTLAVLVEELKSAFAHLDISYAHSPPFRELSEAEDNAVCENIANAGVGLLFVGLGCPKQEAWMASHRGRIPAVMLGVGAAFEFHAGTVPRAPTWMRSHGLEWLHRLSTQPRRLWRRYLHSNSIFVAKTAREMAESVAKRLRGPSD